MNNNVKTTTELKFSSAKVVTSKFLMLKNNLEQELKANYGLYGPGPGNGFTDHTTEANFRSLYNAFDELCELLHQLTTEE